MGWVVSVSAVYLWVRAGPTHVTLQAIGPLGVLQGQLLGVTGVAVQVLPVAAVAGLRLAAPRLQEFGLVCVQPVLRAALLRLLLVLVAALQFADGQRVPDAGVVLHAEGPHLVALLLHECLLVAELRDGKHTA